MEDRRNVGENSCNSGDGTDQTGLLLDVYDDDDLIRRSLAAVYVPELLHTSHALSI